MISYRNSWIRKKLVPWYKSKRGRKNSLETAGVIIRRTICESAGFIRPISVGMYHTTNDDMNDGFGNLTASCREYTLLRSHQDFVVKLWIQRYTEIGPVLEVTPLCHLNVHGVEILISSTSYFFLLFSSRFLGWAYLHLGIWDDHFD